MQWTPSWSPAGCASHTQGPEYYLRAIGVVAPGPIWQSLRSGRRFGGPLREIGGMCPDFTLQAMDGANTQSHIPSYLDDAGALGQLAARAFDLFRFGAWPAQFSAHLARLADELAVAGQLGLDDVEPSPHPLADH